MNALQFYVGLCHSTTHKYNRAEVTTSNCCHANTFFVSLTCKFCGTLHK